MNNKTIFYIVFSKVLRIAIPNHNPFINFDSMKKVSILFLVAVLLLQSGAKLAIVSGYYLNKQFIIDNFCVNKARPELHCDGKCHLKKKIKHHEEHDHPLAKLLKHIPEITLSTVEIDYALSSSLPYIHVPFFPFYSFSYRSISGKSIFQPPKFPLA